MVSHTIIALIVVVVIVIIALIGSRFAAKWYLKNYAVVENLADQSTVYIAGGNNAIIQFAEYSHGCKNIDAKHHMNSQISNMTGDMFLFDASTMNLPAGGRMSFTYKCNNKRRSS